MNEKKPLDATSAKKNGSSLRKVLSWLVRLMKGAVIGIGAILPGISGGVLCVIFGIYQPILALLAHPFKNFKTHAKLLLPVFIGLALGFVGLAGVVNWMFRSSYNVATWLFIGLIAGMIPSLFREAGKKGRKTGAKVSLVISTTVFLAVLFFIKNATQISIRPNTGWYLACGVLWGVSLVVPGLSSSSILIYLGLYQPMTAGIMALSPDVVIPLFAGISITVLVLARAVDNLFKKHYAVAFHMILGFVIASTVAIIPSTYNGTTEIILCIICFAAGFAATSLMDELAKKIKSKI